MVGQIHGVAGIRVVAVLGADAGGGVVSVHHSWGRKISRVGVNVC